MKINIDNLYKELKKGGKRYNESKHCKLILQIMTDKDRGRISSFCFEVGISDRTFYRWVEQHSLFRDCYLVGKIIAREIWELDGLEVRDYVSPPGTINNQFQYWLMIGWSRFGVSKNPRIKLKLNPDDAPNLHYSQLLKQAADGDFTASEIKQLMEAVNIGLNAHQSCELQKQIDELKQDLAVMATNSNVKNQLSNS